MSFPRKRDPSIPLWKRGTKGDLPVNPVENPSHSPFPERERRVRDSGFLLPESSSGQAPAGMTGKGEK